MHAVLVDFENIKRGKERKNRKNRNLKKAIIINLFVKAGAPQKITISIWSYLSYLVSIFHLCSCLSTFTSVLHVNKCIWYNFLVWWFSLCGGKKHPSLFLWLSDAKKVSIGDVILNLHRIWITEEKEIKRGNWTIVPFAGHALFLTCFHFDFFSSLRVSVTRKFIPFEQVNGNTHTPSQLTWLTWLHLSVNIICME